MTLWGRNLTDEDSLLAGLDVSTLSGFIGFTAPPKTFGVSLRRNF